MSRFFNVLTYVVLPFSVLTGFASCDDDDDNNKKEETKIVDNKLKYFATTDMTWAEFYAGELSKPSSSIVAEYDGVTAATPKVLRFSGMIVDSTSSKGVKSVNVAMTEAVYNALKDKSRFTFVKDTTFTEYKELDKDGNFGKMVTKTATQSASSVSLTCGSDSRFAQYVISLKDLDLSSLKDTTGKMANLLGAVVTTSDGSKYGLTPLNNLWLNASEIGFSVSAYTEVHGRDVAYEHTSTLEGKTITNVTYLVKDAEDISVDVNVFVKKQTSATASVSDVVSGSDLNIKITLENTPADANYTLTTVKVGTGKAAKALEASAYSFSNGILTLKGDIAPNTYTVSFTDSKYANIGGTFKVTE